MVFMKRMHPEVMVAMVPMAATPVGEGDDSMGWRPLGPPYSLMLEQQWRDLSLPLEGFPRDRKIHDNGFPPPKKGFLLIYCVRDCIYGCPFDLRALRKL
jgi:hypothetical protein